MAGWNAATIGDLPRSSVLLLRFLGGSGFFLYVGRMAGAQPEYYSVVETPRVSELRGAEM